MVSLHRVWKYLLILRVISPAFNAGTMASNSCRLILKKILYGVGTVILGYRASVRGAELDFSRFARAVAFFAVNLAAAAASAFNCFCCFFSSRSRLPHR